MGSSDLVRSFESKSFNFYSTLKETSLRIKVDAEADLCRLQGFLIAQRGQHSNDPSQLCLVLMSVLNLFFSKPCLLGAIVKKSRRKGISTLKSSC